MYTLASRPCAERIWPRLLFWFESAVILDKNLLCITIPCIYPTHRAHTHSPLINILMTHGLASTSCKSAQEIIGGSLTSSTHCTKNGSAEPTLAFVQKWECFPAWKHQDKLEYLFILSCSLLLWEEAHLEMEVPVKTTAHSWFICFQAVTNNLNLNLKFTQYVIWLCLWTHMVAQ